LTRNTSGIGRLGGGRRHLHVLIFVAASSANIVRYGRMAT
jgi:hypothetical protein